MPKPRKVENFEAIYRIKPIPNKPLKVRPIVTRPITSVSGEPMTPSSFESEEDSLVDVEHILELVAAQSAKKPKAASVEPEPIIVDSDDKDLPSAVMETSEPVSSKAPESEILKVPWSLPLRADTKSALGFPRDSENTEEATRLP